MPRERTPSPEQAAEAHRLWSHYDREKYYLLLAHQLGEEPSGADSHALQRLRTLVTKAQAGWTRQEKESTLYNAREEAKKRSAAARCPKAFREMRWHWPRAWRSLPSPEAPWCTLDLAQSDMGVSKPTVTRLHQGGLTLLSNGRKGHAVRVACVSVRRWHLERVLELLGKHAANLLAHSNYAMPSLPVIQLLVHQERIAALSEEQQLRRALVSLSEI
jgi:hypothetical protein